MAQETDQLDSLVRQRIRALRVAQGWSLDELAVRARLSPSSLSRIETGQRRLALDQLVDLARALDTTLDELVKTDTADVISSPTIDGAHGIMRWPMRAQPGTMIVRQRMTEPPPENPARLRAHPGHEWLVVLSGTAILVLADRRLRIETNQAAEFPPCCRTRSVRRAVRARSWGSSIAMRAADIGTSKQPRPKPESLADAHTTRRFGMEQQNSRLVALRATHCAVDA